MIRTVLAADPVGCRLRGDSTDAGSEEAGRSGEDGPAGRALKLARSHLLRRSDGSVEVPDEDSEALRDLVRQRRGSQAGSALRAQHPFNQ